MQSMLVVAAAACLATADSARLPPGASLSASLSAAPPASFPKYQELFYEQTLDHFRFTPDLDHNGKPTGRPCAPPCPAALPPRLPTRTHAESRARMAPGTYSHRYLLNDDYFGKPTAPTSATNGACKGPILFYTGNEGPIDGLCVCV